MERWRFACRKEGHSLVWKKESYRLRGKTPIGWEEADSLVRKKKTDQLRGRIFHT